MCRASNQRPTDHNNILVQPTRRSMGPLNHREIYRLGTDSKCVKFPFLTIVPKYLGTCPVLVNEWNHSHQSETPGSNIYSKRLMHRSVRDGWTEMKVKWSRECRKAAAALLWDNEVRWQPRAQWYLCIGADWPAPIRILTQQQLPTYANKINLRGK